MNLNFVLIGAAGFIAPRHLKAIKDTKNHLVAAMDKSDSVGILDSYFPDCMFFTEFEEFESYLNLFKREKGNIDFVSICSPNFLHKAHILSGLRLGANVICEKPLVLNTSELEELKKWEEITGRKIYTILQLRHHEKIINLYNSVRSSSDKKKYEIELTYITSRGNWYLSSWKNDIKKSGGISLNIGIHFFDMLTWIFGKKINSEVHLKNEQKMSGFLELENANVKWFLSIDKDDLPEFVKKENKKTFRVLEIDGSEFEFSEGFTELHTISYQGILEGKGYGVSDAFDSISIAEEIIQSQIVPSKNKHSFLK